MNIHITLIHNSHNINSHNINENMNIFIHKILRF
jgi:hypothetical protein